MDAEINLEERYALLCAKLRDADLTAEEQLAAAGEFIDIALDLKRPADLRQAIEFMRNIDRPALPPGGNAFLDYCIGDAFATLGILEHYAEEVPLQWDSDAWEHRLKHLRCAVRNEDDFATLAPQQQCCILNNLGTSLNATGRIIDAIEIWNRLLLIDDSFAVARLNRALAWIYYGDAFHDESHRLLLWKRAYQNMKQISRSVLTAEQADDLDRHLKSLEATVGIEWLNEEINWNDMRIADTAEEATYRGWCLKNCLFLHPLNDAGNIMIASYDAIATPDMVVEYIADGPYRQGFFNQLVQEFVSARFLLYDGLTSRPAHFSDRHVTLADTLDGALFSFGQEKIRLAFRVTYSLVDKIAYFLNNYFHLGIPEKQVSFRSLWHEKRNLKTRAVRSEFKARYSNWSLRALFWLSKDFEEDNNAFQDSIEPEAQKLRSIRDHLEHKLLRIHRESVPPKVPLGQYSITDADFRSKTIRLARLGRSALIYLALAIRHEERSNPSAPKSTVSMPWVPLLRPAP